MLKEGVKKLKDNHAEMFIDFINMFDEKQAIMWMVELEEKEEDDQWSVYLFGITLFIINK